MRKILSGLTFLILAISVDAAQELSTFVYPSEDELEEAFYQGEIDFNQLVILQELIRFGIDSTNLYLLDEIPNLSFFNENKTDLSSELQSEQESPFLTGPLRGSIPGGKISYSYSRELEEDGDFRYRISGEIRASQDVKAAFRLHREYSGLERVVYRNIEIRPKKSPLKRISLGNYTTRLGLGTVMGYRGKLLDFSDEANGESVLYPDYGGYNGLNMKIGNKKSAGEAAVSQNRDSAHSITTAGGSFSKSFENFEPMIIASVTNMKNRISGKSVSDFKYGMNLESKYRGGYNRFEISLEAGESNGFGAFVTEGKHLFESAEINYAGWIYGDEYLDLTGGSKAASISRTSEIDEVEFSFSDKRSGQEGALLKTIVELSDRTELISSFIYAQRDNENYNFEILSAVERRIGETVIIRADHVSRVKDRFNSSLDSEDIYRRTRLELRFVKPQMYVRTYLAYQSKTDKNDYSSFFATARVKNYHFGELTLWMNLGEFNYTRGSLDYWYGFIENKNNLSQNVRTVAKLTHSYRRNNSDKHVSTVTLGVEVAI